MQADCEITRIRLSWRSDSVGAHAVVSTLGDEVMHER